MPVELRTRMAWVLGVGFAVALAACAPATVIKHSTPPLALVWPAAPSPARIAYVRAFTGPDDFGIRKSLFTRLSDFLFGPSDERLVRPMAVAAVDGIVYVADPGAYGVHRFDTLRGEYRLLHAEGETALPSPVALARGAAGEVYVSDSELGAVFVIRPGADAATRLPLDGLRQPTGVAVDPSTGRIWVVDTAAHQVLVYQHHGKPVATIGERGTGDGQFNFPTLLWRDARGHLYVTDTLNFRVQVLDASGRFLRRFGRMGDGSGDAGRQKGVATDALGHVYVVDALFGAFQVFDTEGRFLLSVGDMGQAPGEFWLPTGIFVDDASTIYVADTYNRRVQIFRYVGGPT